MKKASIHPARRVQAAGASAPGQSPRRGAGSRSAAALALLLPLAAAHAVELPRVFGEGMVLQRDQPILVWGRADAGAQVRVALGDQRVETRAGADGHWRVELAPRTAGGPLVMRVDDGKAPVELGDVMIGDVWLASGQSNMEWRLSESADAEVEIARATDPLIRHFKVRRAWSGEPEWQLAGGEWIASSPQVAGNFSAVAHFFARELRASQGVPIGIIDSSWSGSAIEAWMDAASQGIDADGLAAMARQLREDDARALAQARQNLARWELPADDAGWQAPGLDASHNYALVTPAGDRLPAYLNAGKLTFILPQLFAGETLVLDIVKSASGTPLCSAVDDGVQVNVTVGGRAYTAYYYGDQTPKPYLGPLYGPYGEQVTRLNFDEKEHKHHRSLWFSHGLVNGEDTWGEREGNHGYIRNQSIADTVASDVLTSFTAKNIWTAGDGKPLLDDVTVFTFYNTPASACIFDASLTLTANYGDVTAFLSYSMLLLWPAVRFSVLAQQMQNVKISAERLFDILDEQPQVVNRPGARRIEAVKGAVTLDQRSKAKMVSYGLAYGMEAYGLGQRLGIPTDEAAVILDAYFEAFPNVKAYMDATVIEARKNGYTETLFGRRRPIPELLNSNWRIRQAGERQAMNAGIQGLAADIFKVALVRVDAALEDGGYASRLVLQVHDEVLVEVPEAEREAVGPLVIDLMRGAVDLDVPLEVNVAWGTTWADAKG